MEQTRPRVLRVLTGRVGSGWCVAYARAKSGLTIQGNAKDWPMLAKKAGYITKSDASIGAVIVTTESSAGTNTGHVTGPIQRIDGHWAYISEQNYRSKTITEGWIDLDSPLIVTFISKI